MRILILPALMMGLCLANPVMAQEKLLTMPDGQTLLNISATERTQVQQDLLMASLRIEKEGSDPKLVQDQINEVMKKALEKAKAVKDIETSTGGYYVYQYDPNPQPDRATPPAAMSWRGSQTIDLQSVKTDDLLKLAGELQALGLVMNNLSYTLSPAKSDEAKDALMEKTLTKVKTRADRAAKAMGKTKMELIEISVDSSDSVTPYPMMRAMTMEASGSAKMDAPSAEPGLSDITLTVSARALLKP